MLGSEPFEKERAALKIIRRSASILAAVAAITMTALNTAWAEPVANGLDFASVPGIISGVSPDGLGTWAVHYQRVDGGNPPAVDAINDCIDAEANREVQQATWDGATKHPWTYDAAGKLYLRPMTVSEVFTGQYNTDEPTMPIKMVGTVVCDSRSGVLITWDNLFSDKTAGLSRLSDQTVTSLSAVAPQSYVRDWRRSGQLAPVDTNFKYWIATTEGIELHFPEFQFGRGIKIVTVPWAKVADLIAPEFRPVMG
jgi:hypothetical protein